MSHNKEIIQIRNNESRREHYENTYYIQIERRKFMSQFQSILCLITVLNALRDGVIFAS
jgi:hypothetical protein